MGIKRVAACSMWLVILVILLSGASPAKADEFRKGEIQLAEWDFDKDGMTDLDGEWEFYWNQLLEPTHFQHDPPHRTGFIRLPRSWNGYMTDSGPLSGNGYATFRLVLRTPAVDGKLALALPTLFNSYKLWINGELHASAGQVGTDREHTVPQLTTRIAAFQPFDGKTELVIQIANFHHMRGGMTKSILLGTEEQIRMRTDKLQAFEMIVVGTLIFMGVYHLFLFAMRTKDRAPLYFGILSIIWGMRGLLVGQVVWTRVFPDFPWELQIKMEYLALYGGFFAFIVYLRHLFPGAMPGWFFRGSQLFVAITTIPVMITPATMYTHLLFWNEIVMVLQIVFILYLLLKACKERREGSFLLAWIGLFTALTCINDFLYFAELWLYFGSLSPFGLFVFTFGQMFILSKRFTGAFTMAEQYSSQLQSANRELKVWNETLEMKVAERSKELREANDSLQQSFQKIRYAKESRKKLLSYITHDLRSSVAVIVGYAEALSDKIRSDLQPKFIQTIHTRAIHIDHMIDDLYYLSQLESGQIPFRFRETDVCDLAGHVYTKHQLSASSMNLRFHAEIDDSLRGVTVMADPERMERVFDNLIGNAMKFTPYGGTIALRFREAQSKDLVMMTDREADKEVGAASDRAPDTGDRRMGVPFARYVLIEIADTGTGIQPEDLNRIFDPYYKGTGDSKAGTGLGLAICKEIIERHGGRIGVESFVQKGSTFYFSLPVYSSAEQIN